MFEPAAAGERAARGPLAELAVLLSVAYDGAPFSGFALQKTARTVAGELLGAVGAIDPSVREVRGVSRTDAGVHAEDQRVAFDPERALPPRAWALALAKHLPREIAVRRAGFAPRGYQPRFDSRGKRYRYALLFDPVRDPFLDQRAWRLDEPWSTGAFARAEAEARTLVGTHDFRAFRTSADARENTVRHVRAITLERDPRDARLVFVRVEGDGFLHKMVRIVVGTLVDVARGRLREGAAARALESGDRRHAGITAPPDGLCLERVELGAVELDPWPGPAQPLAGP